MTPIKALGSMVGMLASGAVLSFLTVLALTAVLGVELYGRYAWIVSMGGIAALLLQRGYTTTLIKEFAPLDLGAERGPSPVSNTFALYTCATLAALLLATLLSPLVQSFSRPEIIWAAPVATALALVAVADSVLRAAEMGTQGQFAGQVLRAGLFLICVGLLASTGNVSVEYYLAVYALTALLASIVYLWPLLPNTFRHHWKGGFVQTNGAHFQAAVSRSVGRHLPILITGFFVEMEQLAYLAIATRLTGPILFGATAGRAFYGARINRSIGQGDYLTARRDFWSSARFSLAIAILATVSILALIYGLSLLPKGPLAGFDDVGLLILIFVLVSLHQLTLAGLGPIQLVAVLLGAERFVRNLNLVMLAFLTVGLILSGLAGEVWISALILLLYALGLSVGLALKTFAVFREVGP